MSNASRTVLTAKHHALLDEAKPWVEKAAKAHVATSGRNMTYDEAVQYGWDGAMAAALAWDPSEGPWEAYAKVRIRWGIVNGHRERGRLLPEAMFDEASTTGGLDRRAYLPDAPSTTLIQPCKTYGKVQKTGAVPATASYSAEMARGAERHLVAGELDENLWDVWDVLTPQERYAIDEHILKERTAEAVAAELHVTVRSVSRYVETGARKLKAALHARGIDERVTLPELFGPRAETA